MIDPKNIKKILFITLSNLGDIILTTPVLRRLHADYPEAKIDIMCGVSGETLFSSYFFVNEIYAGKRSGGLLSRIEMIRKLRGNRYDIIVDLKNSLIPYLGGAKYHSRISIAPFAVASHKVVEHLSKLSGLIRDPIKPFSVQEFMIPVSGEEEEKAFEIIADVQERSAGDENIKKIVAVTPGAKSHLKRWGPEKFAALADRLSKELDCSVMLTGDKNDVREINDIKSSVKSHAWDLCCKTSVGTLYTIFKEIDLCITGDSAPLHVASASGVPTVALFGPTDEKKYGPLSEKNRIVKPRVKCRPCEKAQCGKGKYEGCIQYITVDEVFDAARELLAYSG